jgi:hypothetical protein
MRGAGRRENSLPGIAMLSAGTPLPIFDALLDGV